jgi:hypothetical protein
LAFAGTRNTPMPVLSRRSPLVRAVTIRVSAFSPFSTTNFSPSITQPSPFFFAVVETSKRS